MVVRFVEGCRKLRGRRLASILVPHLIPELICSDLEASVAFYRLLGFTIGYQRPEERFMYLTPL